MRSCQTRIGLSLLIAAYGLAAFAQTPTPAPAATPAAGDALAALRAKNALADEDRAALRTWIDERLAALGGDSPAAAATAAGELRGATSSGTAGFRDAYLAALSEAVRNAYKNASLAGAARMIAVLAAFNDAAAAPTLIDALRDERAAVRAAAAAGLRELRAKGGGAAAGDALAALREAGKHETAGPALKAIYQALAPAAGGDAKVGTAAVLEVLEARAEVYASPPAGGVPGEGAELAALSALDKQRKALSEDEKKRYIAALATLLRFSVDRYHAELYAVRDKVSSPRQIELRNATELVIEDCETQLADLLGLGKDKAPSVINAMKNMKEESQRVELVIQMNKWAELLEKATGKRYFMREGEGGGG